MLQCKKLAEQQNLASGTDATDLWCFQNICVKNLIVFLSFRPCNALIYKIRLLKMSLWILLNAKILKYK